jgi:phosphoribosyl-AMP cyclohydrolase / phosphoribosyl-ATP pyrophosphohydrolase
VSFSAADIDRIDWDKNAGLVPAIVQHAVNGNVLMLGYMNRAAVLATFAGGRVVFFSRTRQRLWEKGESSGHHLLLQEIRLDCDGDTLLVTALPEGPVCHTGTLTCFGDAPATAAGALGFLLELEQIITQRIAESPEGSYTARLVNSGMRRMAQKLGEEGLEVALAACTEEDPALLGECADLLFHLLVLLRARSLRLGQVIEELRQRHAARAPHEHQGSMPERSPP